MKALNDCVKHYLRVIDKKASQEIIVCVKNDGYLRIPIPNSDRKIVAEARIVSENGVFHLDLALRGEEAHICLYPNCLQSLTIDGEEMVFIYTTIGVQKEQKTQKCLKPGEAVFLEGSTIQISEPDDWGWFYTNEEEGYRVVIKVKKTLGGFGKWKAEFVEAEDDVEIVSIDVLTKNDLPYQVLARIKKGNVLTNEVLFKRISLKRWHIMKELGGERGFYLEDVELVSDSGYYPTYFFFVQGEPGSGKTCWLNALSTPVVQAKLMAHGIYNFDAPDPHLRPNCDDEKILFKKFFLREDEMTELEKLVFVVDLSCEINDVRNNENSIRILQSGVEKYASGIFVVRNEKWLFGKTQCRDREEFYFHVDIPVCNILTGADRIKKALLEGKEEAVNFNLTPDSPIFRWTNMYENMAVSSDIILNRDKMLEYYPCFTVSSCSDAKDEQGNEALDFSKGYNADLPLEFMLQDL